MQLQVMNSPFNQEQAELLNRLLPTLTASQKAWLSGYLAAVQTADAAAALETLPAEVPAASPAQPVSKEVTILFGSQTGNAQGLAENAAKTLTERGFQVTVSAMSDFKPNQLKKLKNLLIVVSTHGEGDPPDNALSFHEFLHGRRAPKLDDLRFSVLALGDTSYEFFCQTGKEFDQRLGELGGTRLHPRVDCDLDYDEPAAAWLDGVISSLNEGQEQGASSAPAQTAAPQAAGGETVYSRKNPFRAEVLENLNLNGRGSNKETRHLELSLEGSGLTYEPGDALGIFPENDPELVDMLLAELKWDPNVTITVDQGENLSLKEALTSYFEITVLTKKFIQQAAELIENEKLRELAAQENADQLKAYIAGRDLIDFVQDFGPIAAAPQEFVSILRKIPPRLYSIASSFAANPDEVHLTIGAVRYNTHGRDRKGVCSVLCAERLQPGDTLPVFIQPNKSFKLPENPEAPIIMVGPAPA